MTLQLKKKIAIIGSGNWGSTIAKIIGNNVLDSKIFEPKVKMYVYEEMINDRKLTEIINTDHENVKYLPGHKLPNNVVSEKFLF
jgi:glycerol-3-phosphate dehydrogenase (NAD+)